MIKKVKFERFKKVAIAICLAGIAVFSVSGCQEEEPNPSNGNENNNKDYATLSYYDLMVQNKDISFDSYLEVNALCNNSNAGGFTDWRMPTLPELIILYQNRTQIGGFRGNYYWSSNLNYYDYNYYLVNFSDGSQTSDYSINQQKNYCRAVRTISQTNHKDYVTLSQYNLMVQKTDIYGSYSEGDAACSNSTVGGFMDWRMPTLQELLILYQNRTQIGGFVGAYYWSSTSNYYDYDYYNRCLVNFSNGNMTIDYYNNQLKNFCRPVRSIH